MENKINVAKLLKDCPSGMELDCMMYKNLYFTSSNVDYYGNYNINCYTLNNGIKTSINFTEYGTFNNHPGAKCVIFPKGKTTWEGFVPPCKFEDGDILAEDSCIFIIQKLDDNNTAAKTYCALHNDGDFENGSILHFDIDSTKPATDAEKVKLFQAIKANGFNWNPETKTLEKLIKPKFKVGDKVKDENNRVWFIVRVGETFFDISSVPNGQGYFVPIYNQDNYELVPNKFDINTLKPFDKVLVRDNNGQKWTADLFSFFDKSLIYPYSCVGHYTNQCIPYEGNEDLLGTSNDCDDFYKTWENLTWEN